MSIGITDSIAPLGAFPLIEDVNVKGSYQVAPSTVERDAIVSLNRKVGMLVRTIATQETWILGPGITNGDWTLYSLAPGAHAASHLPGGADPLTTAAPSVGVGAGNSAGSASSFARSDHDHALRTTTGPADLTIGAIVDGEFLKRVGTSIVSAVAGGGGGGGGNIVQRVTITNAQSPYAVDIADHVIYVDTSGGAITLTLPAHGTTDRIYEIIDIAGDLPTNNCTLARNGGTGTIGGVAADYIMEAAWQVTKIGSDTVSAWWLHN